MVVDSSVWIELLRQGPLSKKCQAAIHKQEIRVPTLVIHEVYKKIKAKISEDSALEAVAVLNQYEVLDMDREVAVLAGDLALQYQLSTVDSLIAAHAELLGDQLLTLDNDFAPVHCAKIIRN
jgi:predicted nucleic acid-binding protein